MSMRPYDEASDDATLGRYRLVAPLGQGGMALVHLACAGEGAERRKLLVIKELRPELSAEPEFVGMFADEGRLAVMLNHGNVVQTYETFSAGGRHCMVMEFLDGQPLAAVVARLGRKSVPLDAHVRVLADMLAGLHYAHELCDFDGTPLDVVHRDVSPQNVFLTYDGRVKVVDFGIAKGALNSTATQTGEFKGKLTYAAPEHLLGEPVTRAADIFSAGVMLWEALTRERVGAGDNEASLLHRRAVGGEPPPLERRPDVPPALDAICRRAMAQRPEDRFATAAEFAQALEDYLAASTRPVGARELAALVGPPFEAERAALRKTIDSFFRTGSQRHAATSARWALPRAGGAAPPRADDSLPTAARTSAPGGRAETPHPRFGPTARWAAGAGAVAIAAAAQLGWRHTAAPRGPTAPPASAAPAVAPAGAFVDLRVRARPAGARVALDGVPLGEAPITARYPRDGRSHQVAVERDGHRPEARAVVFDRDVDLAFDLSPATDPAPTTTPAPPAAPARDARPGRPRPPAPARPPATPKPSIDTDNPYGS
jgi:serine/threonine-protein kinase